MNSFVIEYPTKTSRPHPKDKFTSEEDNLLVELVSQIGEDNWALISSKINGRNTRQCRERWNKYLSPKVNTSAWTIEEDNLLYSKYNEFGAKWKQIAKYFIQRTDINVKNRFLKLERHRKKKENKELKLKEKVKNLKICHSIQTEHKWDQEVNSLFDSIDFTDTNEEIFRWL